VELLLDLAIIFTLRVADVALSTVRIVLLGRGSRWRAAGLGTVESLVWIIAAARVLSGITDPVRMGAFALGFGAGTLLGVTVERWMAIGEVMVRIVAPTSSPSAATALIEAGYRFTVVSGDHAGDAVRVTFGVVSRRDAPNVLQIVHAINPQAIVTTEPSARVTAVSSNGRALR
jgi:uncharacterized protein YebE (UPF0316 family)